MTGKKVYMTIDDAPGTYFRDKVDYLYERHIPAVFFCVGENLEKHEDDAIYAIRKGFVIGNHSYEHGHFSDMSLEECRTSVQKTDEIIEKIYEKSGVVRPAKFFRFPFIDRGGDADSEEYEGKWSKPESEWFVFRRDDKRLAIQAFLKEMGYARPDFTGVDTKFFFDKLLLEGVDTGCTFNQMEYNLGQEGSPYGTDKEEGILARIDEDFPYEGRCLNCNETADIILVHDHDWTTELFYKIIDRYVEKKLEFQSIV